MRWVAALLGVLAFGTGCFSAPFESSESEEHGDSLTHHPCDSACRGSFPLVSEDFYPLTVIKGHNFAKADPAYLKAVRAAVAISMNRIWESSEPLTPEYLQETLRQMHCTYTSWWDPSLSHFRGQYRTQSQHVMSDTINEFTLAIQTLLLNHNIQSTGSLFSPHQATGPISREVWEPIPILASHHGRLYTTSYKSFRSVSWKLPPHFIYINIGRTWTAASWIGVSPTENAVALQSIAALLQKIKNLRDEKNPPHRTIRDETISELSYLLANWLPFDRGNWGMLYPLVVMARRYLATGSRSAEDTSVDRMSNGLDLYMIYGAFSSQDALTVYRAWSRKYLDDTFNAPQYSLLRRH